MVAFMPSSAAAAAPSSAAASGAPSPTAWSSASSAGYQASSMVLSPGCALPRATTASYPARRAADLADERHANRPEQAREVLVLERPDPLEDGAEPPHHVGAVVAVADR